MKNPINTLVSRQKEKERKLEEEQAQRIERLRQLEAESNRKGLNKLNFVKGISDAKEKKSIKKEIAAYEEKKLSNKHLKIIGCVIAVCMCIVLIAGIVEKKNNPSVQASPPANDVYSESTVDTTDSSKEIEIDPKAKADAEARGGHLATITSEAEWLVISNMYGTNVLSCWLGGSDAEEENVWKWVTGEPWKYTRWLSGQPDNYSNGQNYLWMNPDAHTRWGDAGTPGGRTGLYLFEYGYYTDPLNADTDGDGVEDGEEYELGRSPVVNEAEGTANEVVSVECRQRWPWNGLVDIDYEIGGWGTNEEELVVVLRGTATIGEETIELKTVTGEVSAVAGRHRMTWDSAADWGGEGIAEATVRLEIITPYLSVDMIGGANAANWPITRMKEAPEFGWTTDDKTTRLIMRRIEAGRYLMGGQYDVTISRPFYMGVFEVTQREW